ncbi:alginate lyase family protein [Jiangella asiatica]|uniref:Alginate lyase domain-containing protein n=1 Tax=Jiangella asiatica TaxID=2530372 RepID=A0A4R5CYZ3_9ACTN|nr:alginate lyase family protein [Jiangella asiatica]TDE03093.1 hypothetical protein E1269_20765 [Jiangella asiatica]
MPPDANTYNQVSRRTVVAGLTAALAVPALSGAAHATRTTSTTSTPGPGPVIWTTNDLLDRAKDRVARKTEPFYGAWLKTLSQAENVLGMSLPGYHGPNENTYYVRGREHSMYARDLAICYRITGERRFLDKLKELLHNWARDAIDHPYPEPPRLSLPGGQGPYIAPLAVEVFPGSNLPHGTGLRIGRIMPKFADAYAMVWDEMSQDERADVDEWMRLMIAPTLESRRLWAEFEYHHTDGVINLPPYFGEQYFNNHLTAHTLALAAIGYTLRNKDLVEYAINSAEHPRNLQALIDGCILMPDDLGTGEPSDLSKEDPTLIAGMPPPLPGEIWDRYRTNGNRGMLYTTLNLRFLMLMAEMTHNNKHSHSSVKGYRDYYDYVGPNGENLEISFEVYSPWWITRQASSVNSPYYDHEQEDPGFDRIANDRVTHELSSWEFAARQYPGNSKIKQALQSWDRVLFDMDTWGWTAVLTHGSDLGD